MPRTVTPAPSATVALQVPATLMSAQMLVLLLAAVRSLRTAPPEPGGPPRTSFTVLVPAHDEQDGIRRTVVALTGVDYPRDLLEVVVIADNCTDATAEEAARAGATVLERVEPDHRGKGAAIMWALERLGPQLRPHTAIVDADCTVTPNLLAALDRRHRAGAAVVQADDRIGNPAASSAAGLRHAAFVLQNTVRARGRSALGASAGIFGTGMSFRSDLLRAEGFSSSLIEDRELHVRLVDAGVRVAFAPEAAVVSEMPTSWAAGRSQQVRWETGKVALARRYAPRLLAEGIRRRDPARIEAGLDLLTIPQSALALLHLAGLATAAGRRGPTALALANVAAHAAFVAGGLRVGRADPASVRALRSVPRLLLARVGVYAGAARRGERAWTRTAREP